MWLYYVVEILILFCIQLDVIRAVPIFYVWQPSRHIIDHTTQRFQTRSNGDDIIYQQHFAIFND